MIREHPRFQKTAIIFVSAIHLTDIDRLRGYEMGAVDYVPVPVVPEVLRAKVRVFAELYRKTRQLEQLNAELEQRVAERTAELEASTARLLAERAAPQPGAGRRPDGLLGLGSRHRRLPVGRRPVPDLRRRPETFRASRRERPGADPSGGLGASASSRATGVSATAQTFQTRIPRLPPERRGALVHRHRGAELDGDAAGRAHQRRHRRHHRAQGGRGAPGAAGPRGRPPRQERAGAGAVDRAADPGRHIKAYIAAVEGRIGALSRAHTLLSESRWQGADLGRLVEEELAPYPHRRRRKDRRCRAATCCCEPATAQTLALALHELATNAAKYGALVVGVGPGAG